MTDYAKLGTIALLHQDARRRAYPAMTAEQARRRGVSYPPAVSHPQPHTTGWTAPTVIYAKMREIDPGARELNALFQANVRTKILLDAWNAWFPEWQAFFEKYQSAWAFSRWAVPFYSDDLAAQTEGKRQTYEKFRANYANERDAQGNPLPPPSSPIPAVLPNSKDREDQESGITLPWWFWVLGGVALVGGGYYAYRVVKAGRQTLADTGAKQRALEGLLPRYLGPDLGKAAQARAPASSDPNPPIDVAGDPLRRGLAPLAPSDLFVEEARFELPVEMPPRERPVQMPPRERPAPRHEPHHARHERHSSSRDAVSRAGGDEDAGEE